MPIISDQDKMSIDKELADTISLSDDEENFPMPAFDQAQRFILKFGMFKGECLGAMLSTKRRRDYLRYLLVQLHLGEVQPSFDLFCALQDWEELSGLTRSNIDAVLSGYNAYKQMKLAAATKRKKVKKEFNGTDILGLAA